MEIKTNTTNPIQQAWVKFYWRKCDEMMKTKEAKTKNKPAY